MNYIKELVRSIVSLIRFAKVVSRWRWWDYGYSLDIIVTMLREQERMWGNHTHYVGDTFTKKRMQVLLRWYDKWQNADSINDEYKYEQKFVKGYMRNYRRFWD